MTEKATRQPAADEPASAEQPAARSILEDLLDAPHGRGEPVAAATCLIGECVDDRHPTLQGRVRVRLADAGGPARELWVPALQGLPVRVADRVLLMRPGNSDEWIVTGVVDGFARRPEVAKQDAARLELRLDEAIRVVSSEGHELLEISRGQAGPVVRVLGPDVAVELAGKLAIKATSVELEATSGPVTLKASDDVVLKGEVVRLN